MANPSQSKPQAEQTPLEKLEALAVGPQKPSEPDAEAATEAPTIEEEAPIKIIDEAETARLRREDLERRLAASRNQTPERDETELEKSLRPTTWPEFEKAVLDARKPPEEKPYVLPPRTPRQQSQLEEEMEAGRNRQKFFIDQAAIAQGNTPPSEEKLTVEVPRSGAYQNETKTGGK